MLCFFEEANRKVSSCREADLAFSHSLDPKRSFEHTRLGIFANDLQCLFDREHKALSPVADTHVLPAR